MALGQFLVENLLTLLCFDKERCKVIRNVIEINHYTGMYKEIAIRVYDYIDKHKAPPLDHIADLLEDKLKSDNKREVATYEDIILALKEASENINAEYVMSKVATFIKRQTLRTVAVDLTKALQLDTEESLDQAETLIKEVETTQLTVFDPGVRLSNIDRVLSSLDEEYDSFRTGIKEFDKRGFGPTRKELYLYIADAKTGKTWHMIHLAKIVALNNLKVVHISLEMSEDKIIKRYLQAFFAVSKRKETFEVTYVKEVDEEIEIRKKKVKSKLYFGDKKIKSKLRRELKEWENRVLDNVIVKQFPTGKFSVYDLEAYLDNLETTQGFIPDLLIVDYPDLMDLNLKYNEYRIGLANTYKLIRGVAVSRNIAVACPTQSNRAGSGKKQVKRTNVSESYTKIADADVVITYSQTDQEKDLGLARLTVVAGRNDEDNISVILTQLYSIGQYALTSILMPKGYLKYMDEIAKEENNNDSDSDDYAEIGD